MTPIEKTLTCKNANGSHQLYYLEWGAHDNPQVVVCVHGLTRNSRDFDFLARRLAEDFRVLAPDIVGRGKSEWLDDKTAYGYPQYVHDVKTLIAASGVAAVHWVGTSMGGLLGMMLAAQVDSPEQAPISSLLMNDVGPLIPLVALQRIGAYLGQPERFATIDALEQRLRVIAAPFGPLTDLQWRHLAQHSYRELPSGEFAFAYDPGIAEGFTAINEDIDLWPVWRAVRCPTLVMRGEQSDLLQAVVAEQMTQTGPGAERREIAGVGHAPALMDAAQIDIVQQWLLDRARGANSKSRGGSGV